MILVVASVPTKALLRLCAGQKFRLFGSDEQGSNLHRFAGRVASANIQPPRWRILSTTYLITMRRYELLSAAAF